MNRYETIMILNPKLKEEENKNAIQKIKDLITSNGEIVTTEEWGLRKLAYPIQKFNEGYYVLIDFRSEADFIDELNRVYNITDEIIKHIIVKKEEE